MKTKILKSYKSFKKASSGFASHKISKSLRRLCLMNPQSVAQIAFDQSIDKIIRMDILMNISSDHWGSARLRDNSRWVDMMRKYILPRLNELPVEIQRSINWYQEKGL